jgi:hypothetical protein
MNWKKLMDWVLVITPLAVAIIEIILKWIGNQEEET